MVLRRTRSPAPQSEGQESEVHKAIKILRSHSPQQWNVVLEDIFSRSIMPGLSYSMDSESIAKIAMQKQGLAELYKEYNKENI